SLGHGVSLSSRGSGRLVTRLDTPPSSHRHHPDSAIALTEGQQRYVQSLIRERRAPATFRIGSRLYGIKTLETYSDEEINREGSEFKQIVLDHRLRQNSEQWDSFADQMVRRRLQVFGALTERSVSVRTIEYIFENPDLSWDSDAVFKMIGSPPPGTGRHFDRLHRVLKEGLSQGELWLILGDAA
ncbi:hypothetical protein, partial [Bradyrhizobium liaoningense]|uniref:ORC-CDC6 family AAA ATPase n=1 Tax=Bradyrhizobium liaoningense TaxID=43992 RepID=UPI0024E09112